MGYKELAREIRDAYNSLMKDTVFKYYNIAWNHKLETAEISVQNDAGMLQVIIISTAVCSSQCQCRYVSVRRMNL